MILGAHLSCGNGIGWGVFCWVGLGFAGFFCRGVHKEG